MNQYLKKFMKCQIVVGMIVFLFCGRAFGAILSKDMRSKFENMRMAAEVYDRHGRLIGNLCYHRRIWTPIEKIPIILQHAVIAVEDSRFYQHNGVDLRGMARALVKDLIPGGTLQGGSTITQQLAKIVLLSSERTLERKIQDIAYALEIEKNYSKKEILEFYLNSIYLGHGNMGVEAATALLLWEIRIRGEPGSDGAVGRDDQGAGILFTAQKPKTRQRTTQYRP